MFPFYNSFKVLSLNDRFIFFCCVFCGCVQHVALYYGRASLQRVICSVRPEARDLNICTLVPQRTFPAVNVIPPRQMKEKKIPKAQTISGEWIAKWRDIMGAVGLWSVFWRPIRSICGYFLLTSLSLIGGTGSEVSGELNVFNGASHRWKRRQLHRRMFEIERNSHLSTEGGRAS